MFFWVWTYPFFIYILLCVRAICHIFHLLNVILRNICGVSSLCLFFELSYCTRGRIFREAQRAQEKCNSFKQLMIIHFKLVPSEIATGYATLFQANNFSAPHQKELPRLQILQLQIIITIMIIKRQTQTSTSDHF